MNAAKINESVKSHRGCAPCAPFSFEFQNTNQPSYGMTDYLALANPLVIQILRKF